MHISHRKIFYYLINIFIGQKLKLKTSIYCNIFIQDKIMLLLMHTSKNTKRK